MPASSSLPLLSTWVYVVIYDGKENSVDPGIWELKCTQRVWPTMEAFQIHQVPLSNPSCPIQLPITTTQTHMYTYYTHIHTNILSAGILARVCHHETQLEMPWPPRPERQVLLPHNIDGNAAAYSGGGVNSSNSQDLCSRGWVLSIFGTQVVLKILYIYIYTQYSSASLAVVGVLRSFKRVSVCRY